MGRELRRLVFYRANDCLHNKLSCRDNGASFGCERICLHCQAWLASRGDEARTQKNLLLNRVQ